MIRIAQDGTMQRRVVDTARFDDHLEWERLAASAVEFPPPYHAAPGIPIYHVTVGDQVILVAEYDLSGPLLDLVTAVMALGEEVLARCGSGTTGQGGTLDDHSPGLSSTA